MTSLILPSRVLRILAVQAEGELKNDLQQAIGRWNGRATYANSQLEAWMLLHQARFDVVLVNDSSRDGGWKDLIAEIRSMNLTLPVILISSDTDERFCVDALFSGAYDVLRTPLDITETYRVIEQATSERRTKAGPRRQRRFIRHTRAVRGCYR